MAKTKIFELAKELDIHSKDILTFLQNQGGSKSGPKVRWKMMRQ